MKQFKHNKYSFKAEMMTAVDESLYYLRDRKLIGNIQVIFFFKVQVQNIHVPGSQMLMFAGFLGLL